jgi:CxxC motif-containing protein (DUF1111 family)
MKGAAVGARSRFGFPIVAAMMGLAFASAPEGFAAFHAAFEGREAGEAKPGGATSHKRAPDRRAFKHASANMSLERRLDFRVGEALFERIWVSAPSSTKAADGLGPSFNARACSACHIGNGRGHPPATDAAAATSMVVKLSVPPETAAERRLLAEHRVAALPEPTYGGQLQDMAIAGRPIEGRLRVTYTERVERLADGTEVHLRRPDYRIADLGYGPMHAGTMISPRVAPPMIGLGLLERIPEAAILANADPDDANGDGISGHAQRVPDPESGKAVLGRFGWKAVSATLDAQNQIAFSADIGISTRLHPAPWGDCTERQAACRTGPHGDDAKYDRLEAPGVVTDLVLLYSRHIAPPSRRDADDAQVLAGKRVFHRAGCAQCHVPSFLTAADGGEAELRDQLVWPYSDLLLHDMGDGLADGRPEGEANGREWRTAPLWGVGLTGMVSGHTNLLHDGRARGFLEAILWHGGEAEAARERVRRLAKPDRDTLLKFLESL